MGGLTAENLPQEFWSALTPVISASVTSWEQIIAPEISSQMFVWMEMWRLGEPSAMG